MRHTARRRQHPSLTNSQLRNPGQGAAAPVDGGLALVARVAAAPGAPTPAGTVKVLEWGIAGRRIWTRLRYSPGSVLRLNVG